MANANDEYWDASLRHQIGLRRYGSGLTKRVARLLEEADRELTAMLRERLQRFEGKPVDFTSARWMALIDDIKAARAVAMKEYRQLSREELQTLGAMEGAREISLLTSAIPIEVSFAAVAVDQLRAIATSQPFQGRLLREWFQRLEAKDQAELKRVIQLGMTDGEPIDDIVRRVIGTRKKGYTDGVLSVTRRDAQAIVRTAVNHVSNTARNYVWEANSDIITARIWSSTLDGRTSAICRARDGKGTPTPGNTLPEGVLPLKPVNAKPPAHINCRSVMIGYIDGIGLVGKRPYVTDTRNRRRREIDFRKMAREQGRSIQDIRRDWAAENIGRVPADTTYEDFLRRQPATFQNEVLGVQKAKWFREGKLSLSEYVDRNGNEFTIQELLRSNPELKAA